MTEDRSTQAQPLPSLRDELKLLPGPPLEEGTPTWTLYDSVRNSFYRIGWREFEMLSRWRLGFAEAVSVGVSRETTLDVTVQEVEAFSRFLKTQMLVVPDQPESLGLVKARMMRKGPSALMWILKHYLFFRIPLVRPDRFLGATLPVAQIFANRTFLILLGIMGLTGMVMALRQWETFIHTFPYFFSTQGIIYFGLAIFGAKLLHELGHAYTSKHYGLHVPTMGVAFLVLWPVFYSDNTEAWKLQSRKARMAIVASGTLVELALALAATFLWSFLPDGPVRSVCFILATVTWITSLLINLSPFLRFDGYYLLSDFWDVPNLHSRASALGKWYLRKAMLGLDRPCPERLSKRKRRRLILFAYTTWIYRLVLFTGIALLVYHLFFKALGILLFTVEMAWFVAFPIYSEFKAWWQERHGIVLSRHVILTGLLLMALVALLLVPFSSRIHTPALLRSGVSFRIYTPLPAQIQRIAVQNGTQVRTGDLLFELISPVLSFEEKQARIRVRLLESQLERQAMDSMLKEELLVVQQELATAMTELSGYRSQLLRLKITAPDSGLVSDMMDDLKPGRWIGIEQLLCILVNDREPIVESYLEEEILARVRSGDAARFYEENGTMPPLACRIREIDRASSRRLEAPYMASIYGGDIPVQQDEQGLLSQRSMYRALSTLETHSIELVRIHRGTLTISGRPESLISRAWRRAYGVLVRESGF